jgi:uncharacterized FAD-dependent dehydrogenase
MGEYWDYIENFIEDMKKVFPTLCDDWGMYIPEVKYLNEEVKTNFSDLSLIEYPDIYFIGDALSARGITVAGSQGILVASSILNQKSSLEDLWYDGDIISFI